MKNKENKESKATVEAFNSYLKPGIDNTWREDTAYRKANKGWLNKSAKIAIKINRALRNKKMSQKDLADKLSVSAQQVNKILRGRENLTLETISKLEGALDLELISILRSDQVVIKKSMKLKSSLVNEVFKVEFLKQEVLKSEQKFNFFQEIGFSYKELRSFETSVITTKPKPKTIESNTALAA